jgi:hypothetical protein
MNAAGHVYRALCLGSSFFFVSVVNYQGAKFMFRFVKLLVVTGVFLLSSGGSGFAQTITQVDEEWELDLKGPNSLKSSPQLTCSMSPTSNCDSIYVTFVINKRVYPEGKGGGLQVQIWNGNTLLATGDAVSTRSLEVTGEKILWTQRMSVTKGVLKIEILSGTSTTWGKFGGQGELVASTNVSFNNMNGYDANVSADNSGVDFGNQRVQKLILRKVRTYDNNKKSIEKALDRVVFTN